MTESLILIAVNLKIYMKIAIINGPNLNLLGTREPGIYGGETFEHFFATLQGKYPAVAFSYFQSNVEGELINELQRVGFDYTIAAIGIPVLEVHISNVHAREDFRKISHVSAKSKGTIAGLGMKGYELALQYFL